jgi:hypothetical protein
MRGSAPEGPSRPRCLSHPRPPRWPFGLVATPPALCSVPNPFAKGQHGWREGHASREVRRVLRLVQRGEDWGPGGGSLRLA